VTNTLASISFVTASYSLRQLRLHGFDELMTQDTSCLVRHADSPIANVLWLRLVSRLSASSRARTLCCWLWTAPQFDVSDLWW